MNLVTSYLGLKLSSPVFPGASPLSDDLDGVRRLEDAGAPAIVLRSLFEEQLTTEHEFTARALATTADAHAEAQSYLPEASGFVFAPDAYLEHVSRVRESVDLPVIASLNGSTPGGWTRHARLIEQAGAHALELNVYDMVTDSLEAGASAEQRVIDVVRSVSASIHIPVAVKLSPFYSSIPNLAARVEDAGARGLILFNRFYQPDIDPVELTAAPRLSLSDPGELLLRLRWLAIVRPQLRSSLAVTGGVHSGLDAVKAIMAGADGVQVVSALLQHGPQRLAGIREELLRFLEQNEYESLAQMRGNMSLSRCPDPHAFERANYMRLLQGWTG